jgi:hypothetical protein
MKYTIKKKSLDGRNWMIFPNVNKGSGFDNSGARENIAPTVPNEHRTVKTPTEIRIFSVDQTFGAPVGSEWVIGLNQLLFIEYKIPKIKKNSNSKERNHMYLW